MKRERIHGRIMGVKKASITITVKARGLFPFFILIQMKLVIPVGMEKPITIPAIV